jgi:hypothetical protein
MTATKRGCAPLGTSERGARPPRPPLHRSRSWSGPALCLVCCVAGPANTGGYTLHATRAMPPAMAMAMPPRPRRAPAPSTAAAAGSRQQALLRSCAAGLGPGTVTGGSGIIHHTQHPGPRGPLAATATATGCDCKKEAEEEGPVQGAGTAEGTKRGPGGLSPRDSGVERGACG